ncbi:hypothetical protein N0V92_007253 [Colletotrichum tropicale]|nr:hypothetical protein N0V92_007253 [Colletotrichum tropicale]
MPSVKERSSTFSVFGDVSLGAVFQKQLHAVLITKLRSSFVQNGLAEIVTIVDISAILEKQADDIKIIGCHSWPQSCLASMWPCETGISTALEK